METIDINHFAKIKLKTGEILEAVPHPDADKLLVLKVNLGDKTIQLVAGIKLSYKPEELTGKKVVVVENLEPKPLRGILSEGMLLAASSANGPVIISPEKIVENGSMVK
ncbi:MAG: hypothetical protein AB1498_00955 [bacterium]